MTRFTRLPVFSYGFRPFFLAAGVFAVLAIPAWLVVYGAGTGIVAGTPAQLWHAHEMIFGFIAAAMTGFLLTAVPSWTGQRGFAGAPLIALLLAWLAGRIAVAGAKFMPLAVVSVLDLSLLPMLAALLAPPLVRQRNRNVVILGVLLMFWASDAAFLFAVSRVDIEGASRALLAAMNIALLLLTIIAGRLVPAFTSNALRRTDQAFSLHTYPLLERALVPVMLTVIIVDIWRPRQLAAGILAVIAATLHAWRLSGWRSLRTRGDPILWILHVGYAWLPLGFALKAVSILTGAAWAQFWPHAFGIGALVTMILAVMTRASLGHTGRPLIVGSGIAVAYGLLTLAALIRVGAPALWPEDYSDVLLAAGACWTAAFLIFVAVYGPILTSPRADGKPG